MSSLLTLLRSRSGTLNPAALASPDAWFRADSVYSNDGGTSPQTAADGDVSSARELFGGGLWAKDANGVSPKLRLVGGTPTMDLGFNLCGLTLDRTVNLSAWSVHMWAAPTWDDYSYQLWWSQVDSPSQRPALSHRFIQDGPAFFNGNSGAGSAGYIGSAGCVDQQFHHFCWVGDGTAVYHYVDGALVTPEDSTASPGGHTMSTAMTLTDKYYLGAWVGANERARVKVSEAVVYRAAHDQATVLRFRDYFRSQWAAQRPPGPQVVWVGNSLLTGYYLTGGQALPYRVRRATSAWTSQVRVAVPGVSGSAFTARVAEAVRMIDANATRRVGVVWEITNALQVGGLTAAEAVSLVEAAADTLRAAGCERVVGATCLPRSVGGTFESRRQAANTLLRASSHFDQIADVGATGNGIGSDGDSDGANYLDGTHLSDAGNAVALPLFQDAIESVLV